MFIDHLQETIETIVAKGRISAADVRRLQRDVLPDGLASRAEVEALLALDRAVPGADRAWADWLVPAVVDFVVWGERPTGRVDAGAASWLTAALGCGAAPTRAARRIAREIAREAEGVHATIVTFAFDAAAPEAVPLAAVA